MRTASHEGKFAAVVSGTQNPRFSVVIPSYNSAATLGRAIDSVLHQTYPAYEIIVVDDGSTDNTSTVVQQFGDSIHYIRQPNSGVSSARNRAVDEATGDWIAFLDADDLFSPRRLQAHANWLARDATLDFLLGDQELKTSQGKLLHRLIERNPAISALHARCVEQDEVVMQLADFEDLIAEGLMGFCALSVPRRTFLELGGFDRTVRIGEDWHFLIRLCAISKRAGLVTESLAVYHVHSQSTMRKNFAKSLAELVVTLENLGPRMHHAPFPVREGLDKKLRRARLELAYAHLRAHHKPAAIRAALPLLKSRPRLQGLRDVLSVVRGFR